MLNIYQITGGVCMFAGMMGAVFFLLPEPDLMSIEHSVMLFLVGIFFYAMSEILGCLRQIGAALSYMIDHK